MMTAALPPQKSQLMSQIQSISNGNASKINKSHLQMPLRNASSRLDAMNKHFRMSAASMQAQSVPATFPQNTSISLKGVATEVVYTIGSKIKSMLGGIAPQSWLTEPSDEDPSKWVHDPENNRAVATFGAGCYWGTEKFFCTDFAARYPKEAIIGTSVGFMSPNPNAMKNPNYYQVCSGQTGHVEVL